MKKVAIFLIFLYQRTFSIFSIGSCRFYPSCSEYAKWQFQTNSIHKALFYSLLRILRCNQLFSGGIDYPILHKKVDNIPLKQSDRNFKIKFWLVKKSNSTFFVIKNIDKR